MAQSKTTQSDDFDSLVIGGGLAGLIVAHQLEGTGRKVALIEGLDALGGSCRPAATKAGIIDHGLKLLPDSLVSREILAWLGTVLGKPIDFECIEVPVQTFDEGKFKPFIGFGDQKVRTAHEIAAYAQERYLRPTSTPKNWIPLLSESFTGALFNQSYVTKMQVDDEFVIEVLINGSKRLSGREVIFCASPQQLVKLLPEVSVPAKLRQKLVKGEIWTSLCLDLVHSAVVTESAAVHVLKGANEEPSVGLFHPPTILEDQHLQVSQWLTLVPRDLVDDDELVASALKQIKRQIKRAYETAFDGEVQERIIVNPSSHGDLVGTFPETGRWPKLQNLHVISGLFDSAKNLLGNLCQTRRTLAAIAGEPAVLHSAEHGDEPQPTA